MTDVNATAADNLSVNEDISLQDQVSVLDNVSFSETDSGDAASEVSDELDIAESVSTSGTVFTVNVEDELAIN